MCYLDVSALLVAMNQPFPHIATGSAVQDFSKVTCSIELITPDQAKRMLEKNFDRNRSVSKSKVIEWAREMKNGRWNVGCDAIGFDASGKLINGQHRLHAIVLADRPAHFSVIRNLPYESSATMDIGRKRTASERQYILGYNCNTTEFAMVRNALTPWSDARMGSQFYRDTSDLEFVAKTFQDHEEFVKYVCSKYSQTSGIFKSVSLKIYAQMSAEMSTEYPHGMGPMDRCIMWLDICTNGFSEERPTQHETDLAALVLKRYADNLKSNRVNFTRKEDYRRACMAASKFMRGETTKHLGIISKSDPFKPLEEQPPTSLGRRLAAS